MQPALIFVWSLSAFYTKLIMRKQRLQAHTSSKAKNCGYNFWLQAKIPLENKDYTDYIRR